MPWRSCSTRERSPAPGSPTRARRRSGRRGCPAPAGSAPDFTSSKAELDLCDELGIAFLPWSPLGGFSGAASLGGKDSAFVEIAGRHGVSPQQVCLAWHLALSPVVIPIPGASRPATILDSLKAADLDLSGDEIAALSTSVGL